MQIISLTDGEKVPTWLQITLIFICIISFIIFLFWLDWKFKRWKTVKVNKMILFVSGYAFFREEGIESALVMMNGLLGINSKELIFEHRFNDDATHLRLEFSNIKNFGIMQYTKSEFLRLIHESYDVDGDEVKYYAMINMAGLSIFRRIPKAVQSRMLCNISYANGSSLLFCFKDTIGNIEIIKEIESKISSNQV